MRALLTLLALGSIHSRLQAQDRCLSNPDTAAAMIADVRYNLSNADSATLVRDGLPFRPTSVTLVTDDDKCAAAFDSYNALGPAARVDQAYLIQVESSAFVMVPVTEGYRRNNTRIYMTNDFKMLYAVVDLD